MASTNTTTSSSSAREELLSCPVCLELFAMPVGLACGHTFCKACVEAHWASGGQCEGGAFTCPVCCRVYRQQPELSKNVLIAQLVEEFHEAQEIGESLAVPTSSSSTAATATCRDVPRCGEHGKPLEFHCRTDGTLLCAACMLLGGRHWGHGAVAVEMEHRARREQLDHFKQRLEEEERKTTSIMSILEGTIHSVLGAAEEVKARLMSGYDELLRLISKEKAAAMRSVDEGCRSQLSEIHEQVERCSETLGRLQEALSAIYSLDDTREHVAFLEGCILNWESFTSLGSECAELPPSPALGSVTAAPLQERVDELLHLFAHGKPQPPTGGGPDAEESILPPFTATQATQVDSDDRAEEVRPLQPPSNTTTRTEETEDWNLFGFLHRVFFGQATPSGPSYAELVCSYSHTPTLNPNSAHPRLRISGDRLTVRVTWPAQQHLADHPDRFDGWYQALGSEGVSSGRGYWEVDVSSAGWCCVGVAYGSIARKGHGEECWLGHNDTSWGLYIHGNEVTAQRRGMEFPVTRVSGGAGGSLRRVGVYVDFEGGLLSFYSAGMTEPLHTFHHKFTRPLLPALGLYDLFVLDANVDNSLSIVELE
ncbi:tripartite motif-containing protein 14-like [Lampetra planeri]